MSKTKLSFSTLSIPCDGWLAFKIKKGNISEILPADETTAGIDIHNALALRDFDKVREIIGKDWIKPEKLFQKWENPDLEISLPSVEWEDKYILTGKIDFLKKAPAKIVLVDYKGQWSKGITARTQKQLRFYAYPFLKEGKEVETYVYIVRWDLLLPTERESLDPFVDTEKIEEEIRQQITRYERIVNQLSSDDKIYCQASQHCTYCPKLLSCEGKPIKLPTTEDEARDLLTEVLRRKEAIKAGEKLLKSWCDVNGIIQNDEKEAGFFPSERYIVDGHNIFSEITQQGGDPFKYVNFTKTAIYKAEHDGFEVSKFTEVIIEPRWGIKKREE
jgi:hypothetical protein